RLERSVPLALVRRDKGLVRPPASAGELLLGGEEREGILDDVVIFAIAEREVRFCSGAKRDGVRVGVLTRKGIASAGKRVKELAIEQVAHGKLMEDRVAGERVRGEEVLRHDVAFVVGWILLADAVTPLCGEQRLRTVEDAGEQVARVGDVAQCSGVDEASEVFVENVAGPEICLWSQNALVVRTECGCEAFDEHVNLFVAGLVTGGGAETREAGDVLAQRVAGDEAVQVVPTAHVAAWRWQPGSLAVDLKQAVVVEA